MIGCEIDMLKMRDLDYLHYQYWNNRTLPTIYYIAHNVELREGYADEVMYKSKPGFSIIEIKVKEIRNALWELMDFQQFPDDYYTTSQTVIMSPTEKYVHYFTESKIGDIRVPQRLPSIIYGVKRVLYKNGAVAVEYNDPSPVQPVYTNELSFMEHSKSVCEQLFNDGKLNWKYKEAIAGTIIDGIPYKYITSPWYILKTDDLYHLEHHLVNVNQKNAFFLYPQDALSYKEELEA